MRRFFPFLGWFPLTRQSLRADLVAGITVAIVLVPQSMAYAQLAGMPAYYGLYAAFLPVIIGAMWGSSRQLATGPVAMVSLLTGSAPGISSAEDAALDAIYQWIDDPFLRREILPASARPAAGMMPALPVSDPFYNGVLLASLFGFFISGVCRG